MTVLEKLEAKLEEFAEAAVESAPPGTPYAWKGLPFGEWAEVLFTLVMGEDPSDDVERLGDAECAVGCGCGTYNGAADTFPPYGPATCSYEPDACELTPDRHWSNQWNCSTHGVWFRGNNPDCCPAYEAALQAAKEVWDGTH